MVYTTFDMGTRPGFALQIVCVVDFLMWGECLATILGAS